MILLFGFGVDRCLHVMSNRPLQTEYIFTDTIGNSGLCAYHASVAARTGLRLPSLEVDFHDPVHPAVGGAMGGGLSPAALVFFAWHARLSSGRLVIHKRNRARPREHGQGRRSRKAGISRRTKRLERPFDAHRRQEPPLRFCLRCKARPKRVLPRLVSGRSRPGGLLLARFSPERPSTCARWRPATPFDLNFQR
jgi:hypothetical protein